MRQPHAIAASILVLVVGLLALLPARTAEAATATKTCSPAGTNVVSCAFTVVPGVPTNGSWLVQMVTPNAGTMTGLPTIGSATGCIAAVAPGGSLISTPQGNSDYDVAVSSCGAGASVTIIETIAVTSSGQVCQRVWVNTSSPFAQACANVTYTPPGPSASSAAKSCTPTSTLNEYTCLFTVAPAFPVTGNDIIHVNEPPGPPMTGPGTITSTPVVSGYSGCFSAPGAVLMTGANMYQAPVGAGGCSGTWSVTFAELVTVTGDGAICQSYYIVAAAPPVTSCATVTYTAPSGGSGSPGGGGSSSGSGSSGGGGSPGGSGSPGTPPGGGFVTQPNFGAGMSAMVIFRGGAVDDLEAATVAAGGAGVWVQDADGAFQLLIANGPAFLKAAFAAKFPMGFAGLSSVTVTRGG